MQFFGMAEPVNIEKKAPVRRRERRKRDNEQELKCKIGLNLGYNPLPVKSSIKKMWVILARFFNITAFRQIRGGKCE